MNALNDSDVLQYQRTCYTRVNMSTAEFVANLDSSDSPRMCRCAAVHIVRHVKQHSFAGRLDTLSEELSRQSFPLTPFMVLPPDYRPENEHKHRKSLLWISPANSTTPGVV